MGYDLRNQAGETYHYGVDRWQAVLQLAMRYGWEPSATILLSPLDEIEPSGDTASFEVVYLGYTSNDGQEVLKEDALEIARALEQSLDDIPDVYTPSASADDLYGVFSGRDEKTYLRGFIEFCKTGSFRIC